MNEVDKPTLNVSGYPNVLFEDLTKALKEYSTPREVKCLTNMISSSISFQYDIFRPYKGRDVGIESWQVILPKEDIAREILKNEMIRRKSLFLKALQENNVSLLPRLTEAIRSTKCPYCKFYQKCMNEDSETEDAREMAKEIDLLDISGVVDFKPFSDSGSQE
jgi:hypothetical protein